MRLNISAGVVAVLAAMGVIGQQHVDVVIIGGGLAGLSTAKDIAKSGRSFAILEARGRVGGRVLNFDVGNRGAQEMGAEFVGPTQDRVLALAATLGLETYPTYTGGNNTFYRNHTVSRYSADFTTGGLPPVGQDSVSELLAVIQELDTLASQIEVNAPWKHPNAPLWDGQTLESFFSSRIKTSDARAILDGATVSVLAATPSETSLLYWLAYIASAGNSTTPGSLLRLVGTQGGAQESRINGGTALLATRLADKLGHQHIHLNSPVQKITRKGNRYMVYSNSKVISATHVVVAMSPPLASRIIYDPPLPAGRDQLTQRMPMGALGKVIAIYPDPWWRKHNLSAQVLSDTGVVRSTFDNTPANSAYGAIMAFVEADEMRKADELSERQLKESVIADLVTYFGSEAAKPTKVLIQRWDLEEFSRGGPVAYAPPGVLTQYGSFLRTPHGNIHFAGTETAEYWTGYMDGAIRSGERTAQEILRKF